MNSGKPSGCSDRERRRIQSHEVVESICGFYVAIALDQVRIAAGRSGDWRAHNDEKQPHFGKSSGWITWRALAIGRKVAQYVSPGSSARCIMAGACAEQRRPGFD